MPTILLTGFEPFGGEAVNPSWEAVRRLDGWECRGHRVAARLMPCVFGASLDALDRAVAETDPVALLGVGQAQSRAELSLERVAVNLDDARIPDTAGNRPVDAPVVAGGPAAYFASLPVKAIAAALRDAGIPAGLSHSAGSFVCNHLFYGACHLRAVRRPALRVGFLHIPLAPEQAVRHPGVPSMAIEQVVAGLRIAVETILTTAEDRHEPAGTLE
ncbi:pyroglutamyl-peptidase I (plasmid) [Azospirillum humicireducens]|uniref:Pyrrolidone-carboxylate peptidase n=1 Tax=Azospirillum humicireducens TaxID=1226968 RepID=A0A2R4VUZ1_9PROT|nr:pyroglutamyl-peptidase I [Azospirillum humicireducens]AWB08245.1 pyroglutamyl-peptidase I [Azospirillum humicireducens]